MDSLVCSQAERRCCQRWAVKATSEGHRHWGYAQGMPRVCQAAGGRTRPLSTALPANCSSQAWPWRPALQYEYRHPRIPPSTIYRGSSPPGALHTPDRAKAGAVTYMMTNPAPKMRWSTPRPEPVTSTTSRTKIPYYATGCPSCADRAVTPHRGQ